MVVRLHPGASLARLQLIHIPPNGDEPAVEEPSLLARAIHSKLAREIYYNVLSARGGLIFYFTFFLVGGKGGGCKVSHLPSSQSLDVSSNPALRTVSDRTLPGWKLTTCMSRGSASSAMSCIISVPAFLDRA